MTLMLMIQQPGKNFMMQNTALSHMLCCPGLAQIQTRVVRAFPICSVYFFVVQFLQVYPDTHLLQFLHGCPDPHPLHIHFHIVLV
jgi:hypothetical protein